MPMIDEKTKRFAVNSLFPSFFYAALGLVLAEMGAAQAGASWGLHVFLGAPGLVLSGLTLFRARQHWPTPGADMPSFRAPTLGWYFLLLAVGICIGMLVSAGSVLLVGIGAALTYLVPWTKVLACRARFVMSSMLLLAGALAWPGIYGIPVQPLHLMIAAWVLLLPPMFMQCLVMASLDREYRIHGPRITEKADPNVRVPIPQ